jgi:hypothetical protein
VVEVLNNRYPPAATAFAQYSAVFETLEKIIREKPAVFNHAMDIAEKAIAEGDDPVPFLNMLLPGDNG